MDIMGFLTHGGVVVAIVMVAELIKHIAGQRLQRYYVLIPLVLGALAGVPISFQLGTTAWYDIVLNVFMYAAASSFVYQFGKSAFRSLGAGGAGRGQPQSD